MIQKLGLKPIQMAQSALGRADSAPGAAEVSKQFGAFLNDALGKVNEQSAEVGKLTRKFAAGELEDVHSLLIASEKASLGLELTLQIRNKAVEAYQEIMRTQI